MKSCHLRVAIVVLVVSQLGSYISPTFFVRDACAMVDQDFIQPRSSASTNVGSENRRDQAQTFTVGITGRLTGIDVLVGKESIVTQPLLYDIRKTDPSGVPTEADFGSDVLASGMIDADSIPLNSLIVGDYPPSLITHIDFGNGAFSVSAGEVLAIVLQTNDQGTSLGIAYSWRSNQEDYPRGMSFSRGPDTEFDFLWKPRDTFDIMFRTHVTPVPEPNGLAILTLSMPIVLGFRRR